MGHILELQQQHCEGLKNAEASIADGVVSRVASKKTARSLRIIGSIVAFSSRAFPSRSSVPIRTAGLAFQILPQKANVTAPTRNRNETA